MGEKMIEVEIVEDGPLTDDEFEKICSIGRGILKGTLESLDRNDMDRDHIISALTVALAGAMKILKNPSSMQMVNDGIGICEKMWKVDDDGNIHFVSPGADDGGPSKN